MSDSGQPSTIRRYRRLLAYGRRYRSGWVLIAALNLLSGFLALAQPWPMKVVIDHVLAQRPSVGALGWLVEILPGAAGSRGGLLLWAAFGTLGIFLLGSLIDVMLAIGWLRVGQQTVYDLAQDLFARLQRHSLRFHSRAAVGDLMSRVTTDSFCVYRLIDTIVISPVKALLMAGATAFIMAQLNGQLTLIAMLAAPLMGTATFLLGRKVRAASRTKRQVESRIQTHVQQTLSGVQVVQAFGQENREYDRFHEYAAAAIRAHQRNVFLGNVSNLWTGLIVAAGTGVTLLLGSRLVLQDNLTVGELLVFLAYLATLQGHFQSLARVVKAVQALRGEMDRVSEILESNPEVLDNPGALTLPRIAGHIRVENVTFGYDAAHPVLRQVNLEALPGETIAIVGATGAGKTTLTSLIPRFFDPQEGRVLLDGHDLRELRLSDLRRNVGIVLQEPFLFPFTVRENITYGRPDATLDEVVSAARAANADEFIDKLPEKYDTVIGERGLTLSGGQRQRLSIARALLKDAPVLVLDEPTSALDAHAEQLLVQALQRLMKGRTTFIIAHRLSTIRHASRIAVLDAGRVVELGNHEELLALGGAYARMHQLQTGAQPAAGKEGA